MNYCNVCRPNHMLFSLEHRSIILSFLRKMAIRDCAGVCGKRKINEIKLVSMLPSTYLSFAISVTCEAKEDTIIVLSLQSANTRIIYIYIYMRSLFETVPVNWSEIRNGIWLCLKSIASYYITEHALYHVYIVKLK